MILDRSCGELSDVELSAAVRVVAVRRNELAAAGRGRLADGVADVLDVLVDERDRRRVLYLEMDAAAADAVVRVLEQ